MTRISDRFFQLAVLAALAGMGLGIGMGLTENFQFQAVHAHINLLGWVSMMLYGMFYRAVPKAAEGRLPLVHFWLSVVSSFAMMALLAVQRSGVESIAPALGVAALGVWLSVALFAVIVFRATWRA
jgi:cbb3-type cytochrome oxidase subunit 1